MEKSSPFCAIGWRCFSERLAASCWKYSHGAGHRLRPLRKVVRARECGAESLPLQRQGAAGPGHQRHPLRLVRLRRTVLRPGAGKVALS